MIIFQKIQKKYASLDINCRSNILVQMFEHTIEDIISNGYTSLSDYRSDIQSKILLLSNIMPYIIRKMGHIRISLTAYF